MPETAERPRPGSPDWPRPGSPGMKLALATASQAALTAARAAENARQVLTELMLTVLPPDHVYNPSETASVGSGSTQPVPRVLPEKRWHSEPITVEVPMIPPTDVLPRPIAAAAPSFSPFGGPATSSPFGGGLASLASQASLASGGTATSSPFGGGPASRAGQASHASDGTQRFSIHTRDSDTGRAQSPTHSNSSGENRHTIASLPDMRPEPTASPAGPQLMKASRKSEDSAPDEETSTAGEVLAQADEGAGWRADIKEAVQEALQDLTLAVEMTGTASAATPAEEEEGEWPAEEEGEWPAKEEWPKEEWPEEEWKEETTDQGEQLHHLQTLEETHSAAATSDSEPEQSASQSAASSGDEAEAEDYEDLWPNS